VKETKPRRAFIYTRISIDRDLESEAPDRQLDFCRAHCKTMGWEVMEEFIERDRSAFTKATVRPQYEAMLERVRAGEANTVVAFKIDRVGRRVAELARLVDEFRELGVALVCPGDGIDTSTSVGALVATIIGAIAQMESEANSQRRIAKNRADAANGKYVKGGFRAFGRTMDGSLVDGEADAIRVVAQRVIEGATLGSQARWLNEQGLRTTTDHAWLGTSLGRMLREPHLRGIRVHNGEEHRGDFEPILDEVTGLRLIERLQANPAPKKGRVHLLSGLAFCAKCGGRMNLGQVSHPNDPTKPKFVRYQCIRYEREGNCGSVSASENSLDAFVIDQFFMRIRLLLVLGKLDYSYASDDGPDRRGLLDQIEEATDGQSELATARFADRTIGESDYNRLWLDLQDRIDSAQSKLRKLDDVTAKAPRDFDWWGDDPERAWEEMPDLEKRGLLRSLIESVQVAPAKHRGGNKFDTSRVTVIWPEWAEVPDWMTETAEEPASNMAEFEDKLRSRGWEEIGGRWTKQ
jgi:DNA invertase Pin-like site-specific DNA recombinase